MACNCNTKKELDELYRLYGEKQVKNKAEMKKSVGKTIKYYIWQILIFLLLGLTIPFIFLYFIFRLFWEDSPKININNFNLLRIFKLKDNV